MAGKLHAFECFAIPFYSLQYGKNALRPVAGQPILGRRFGARRRRLLRWGFICCWLQKDALRPKQSSADQQPSEAREERGSWLRHRYSTRHEEEMGEDVRPKSRKWR